jgi:dTDP-4-amino-4,6-dideoxygalactose transaminase
MKKRSPNDLAILGGATAWPDLLHVGRPNLPARERFLGRVGDLLDRCWLTNDGPLVRELEDAVARRLEVPNCVAVCNGTVGLLVAMRALDLTGEVVVPSLTFPATVNAVAFAGLTPVFADIDPDTMNLDPDRAREAITPSTRAILPVHLFGRPAAPAAFEALAAEHGVRLLFDAAHALACGVGGRMVGGFGDLEVLSFHATKLVHSFEGGFLTTRDDALADRLRRLRNHGFVGEDVITDIGINAKMSEIAAAMGLTMMEDLDDVIETNRRNDAAYRGRLAGRPGIEVRGAGDADPWNAQYVVLRVDPAASPLDRDELIAVLRREGVRARRYFWPGVHRQAPYRDVARELPETEFAADRLLCLPTGTAVDVEDVAAITGIIDLAFEGAARIREQLRRESTPAA